MAKAIKQPLPREPVHLVPVLPVPVQFVPVPGGIAVPVFRGVPQFPQKLALVALSRPQLGHFIGR